MNKNISSHSSNSCSLKMRVFKIQSNILTRHLSRWWGLTINTLSRINSIKPLKVMLLHAKTQNSQWVKMMDKYTINRYKLPIPKNQLQRIDRTSSPAHVGKLRNAIDFVVDEKTPVSSPPPLFILSSPPPEPLLETTKLQVIRPISRSPF